MMRIYVGNLSFQTSDDSLQEMFEEHGEVVSAKVITDRETGRSRGFGFVEMSNDEAAQKAIDALDQQAVDGRTLNVGKARPRGDRKDGRGGGGGGEGY